jgi:hypothetical protein
MRAILPASVIALAFFACGDDSTSTNGGNPNGGSSSGSPSGPAGPTGDAGPTIPATATCTAAGGSATVAAPTLLRKLVDPKGVESWLASPAIADLDHDGKSETIVVREARVVVWGSDGVFKWEFDTGKDRIWASPIVGNFTGDEKLEIAIAARDSAWIIDASGKVVSGFPQKFGTSETRAIAAGDLDGDGALDLAVAVRNQEAADDIVKAYHGNGAAVAGFPPSASGVSGCSAAAPCYFAGLYDQNIAIGPLEPPTDGQQKQGLVIPHDDAYASFFHGSGVVYDSNPMFKKAKKTAGVRYLHDLPLAIQGYADDESTANQAHFTNTAPAIADIDEDGTPDIVMVGSVQNASQDDRLRGVGLWVMKSDASRHAGWESPFHVPAYVMGLNDGFSPGLGDDPVAGADNLVGLTNEVTIADLDERPGLEMIFAGYDGKIHAVAADKTELWSFEYATNGRALTPGLLAADLSADGVPEVVFATYTPDKETGALYILSAKGQPLQKLPLPGRGAMAVPTIGDANDDGVLDIVVSLKDEIESKETVHVYAVPGSKANCLLWPTGRANFLRNGWVR